MKTELCWFCQKNPRWVDITCEECVDKSIQYNVPFQQFCDHCGFRHYLGFGSQTIKIQCNSEYCNELPSLHEHYELPASISAEFKKSYQGWGILPQELEMLDKLAKTLQELANALNGKTYDTRVKKTMKEAWSVLYNAGYDGGGA